MNEVCNKLRVRLQNALSDALWEANPPNDSGCVARLRKQGLLIRAEAFADAIDWLEQEELCAKDKPLGG